MKFRLTAVVLLSICLSNAFADEGMWLLGNLKKNKQTERVMKDLGLQMPVNKLYNPKKPCLADAVVSFGGFCSGVVVSDDGLVFTNHHCGFSSIQQHSSVECDYLKDGFVARSFKKNCRIRSCMSVFCFARKMSPSGYCLLPNMPEQKRNAG